MQEKTVSFNGAARIAGIITLPDGGMSDPNAAASCATSLASAGVQPSWIPSSIKPG